MDIADPRTVQAIIADPRFAPPPPEPGPMGTMRWLRSSVVRFSSGETHARRRALVERDLAALDPAVLRKRAAESTVDPEDVPTAVLAGTLGFTDVPAALEAVREVAAAYHGGAEPDEAVATLVKLAPPAEPEVLANRIGLLIQAYAATAAMITSPGEPPVRFTRRQALRDAEIDGVTIPAGTVVRLDISTFPFGGDARPCPGREHALALVAGVSQGKR
ncbi:hypothetical protein [Actinocrispum sp. NPDC049592]|uniref:hypothetical protein n=1 Tax=Actinocrispum sp. NPDC049592 TaxID=3154835 RepID=UPI00341D8721